MSLRSQTIPNCIPCGESAPLRAEPDPTNLFGSALIATNPLWAKADFLAEQLDSAHDCSDGRGPFVNSNDCRRFEDYNQFSLTQRPQDETSPRTQKWQHHHHRRMWVMPHFCCAVMRKEVEHLCSHHPNTHDCPDHLIGYSARFDEYGIIIHDGGTSSSIIAYCPWCGTRLPESKRDRWFAEIEARGLDPDESNIPEEYKTEAWYQAKPDR
jgi:hypothetical protein